MKEKYFLVNNFLPCICTCHEACLRKDLINRGYFIFSMKRISKKDFDNYLKKLQKNYKNISFDYTYFN